MEQLVALAGGAFERFAAKFPTGLQSVVAAGIHGFAHFVDAVLQRLAGFQGAHRHQLGAAGLQ